MTAEPQGKTCPNFRFQTSLLASWVAEKDLNPSAIVPCAVVQVTGPRLTVQIAVSQGR
jgi:hypothetical protein